MFVWPIPIGAVPTHEDIEMDDSQQRSLAEALILAATEPIPAPRIASVIPDCTPARARSLVEALNADYEEQGRGFEIREVAGGYQLRTRPEFAEFVRHLAPARPLRLSQAALETLAVVAYRQPATRAEVEFVRGVDAGAVMRGLLERKLLRIAGHREVPGRPLLYATTRRFLEVFDLATLEDLPTLRDLEDLTPVESLPAGEGAPAADGWGQSTAGAPGPVPGAAWTDAVADGEPH